MATFTITHGVHLDDVSAVQTLTPAGIGIGDSITVTGAGAKYNGTFTVVSVEPYEFVGLDGAGYLEFNYQVAKPNQVVYEHTGHADSDGYEELDGTLTWTQTCTWITDADVTDWLGIGQATANDTDFITVCTAAANAFCYRKRTEAGYFDSLTTVPGNDVKLGTVMYAATLYRERGSVDSFASFEGMGSYPVPATLGRIMQLLGCGRAQVA